MRVWIIGDNIGFPNGQGSTARVHGFAQALRAAGAELRVICMTPTELSGRPCLNAVAEGVHDGIPFEYTCGTTLLPAGLLARRWLRVRSALRTGWSARRARPDVVIAMSQTLTGLILQWLVARAVGARCVLDASELPSGFIPEYRREIHRRLYARLAQRLDGILVISTYLERYFAKHARVPLLRVPILMIPLAGGRRRAEHGSRNGAVGAREPDEGRPAPAGAEPNAGRGTGSRAGRSVVYAGSLAHGDEIAALLEAFATVAAEFPDARLEVLGDDPNGDALIRFPALAKALGIGQRVEFAGAVAREAVQDRIGRAAVLALPRPKTPWAEAGLSTKVAEYLATGRPVVVTAIGDIPLYLEDRVSAYLVAPGDPAAFSAALRDALVDPSGADRIGAGGLAAADRHFSVLVQGPRIARFLESLL